MRFPLKPLNDADIFYPVRPLIDFALGLGRRADWARERVHGWLRENGKCQQIVWRQRLLHRLRSLARNEGRKGSE